MSKRGSWNRMADNIARFFDRLRQPRRPVELAREEYELATDEGVITAIKTVPKHFSAHRIRLDSSISPFMVADPAIGNTTAGGGILADQTEDSVYNLQSTATGAAEVRTLKDPVNAYLWLTFVLTVKSGGQNLAVQGQSPMWIQANLNNFTQNGNFINFTAIDQWCQIFSVPCTKVSRTTVHNSPFVNTSGFRWAAGDSDGATVN